MGFGAMGLMDIWDKKEGLFCLFICFVENFIVVFYSWFFGLLVNNNDILRTLRFVGIMGTVITFD